MASPAIEPFFELNWGILTSVGIGIALIGILVIGITSFTPLTVVPVVVSVACALANGLCYYAFYTTFYSIHARCVAGAFADVFWLIQEAGLSFYSYQLLIRLLQGRTLALFLAVFWTIISCIIIIRGFILYYRVIEIRTNSDSVQNLINRIHIGYFVGIAMVESWSSFFLLRIFVSARRLSKSVHINTGVFKALAHSTEMRVSFLCFIGIWRATTHAWQTQAQATTGVVPQLDKFGYALTCIFPMLMLVDILASRLAAQNDFPHPDSASNRRATLSFANPDPFASHNQQDKMDRRSFMLLERDRTSKNIQMVTSVVAPDTV